MPVYLYITGRIASEKKNDFLFAIEKMMTCLDYLLIKHIIKEKVCLACLVRDTRW